MTPLERVARLRPSRWTLVLLATSCLPVDTRPPPGKILATTSSDDALRNGFVTADGWSVHYGRFLASLGNVSPEGDDCTFYSDTAYNRVIDELRSGPQRLSTLYALGPCQIDFEVSSPWSDSVLGEGVTAADRDLLRVPATDDEAQNAGISILVEGTATRDGVEKRFTWAFRNRIDYADCFLAEGGKDVHGVDLSARDTATIDFTAHGATLFETSLDEAAATLVFDPFASADDASGNADGEIALSELGAVSLRDVAASNGYADADPAWTTLEDYVYLGQFPRIVQFRGEGDCAEKEVFANDRDPH